MATGVKTFFNGTMASIDAKAATPVLPNQALETSVTDAELATAVEAGLTVMKLSTTYQERRASARTLKYAKV